MCGPIHGSAIRFYNFYCVFVWLWLSSKHVIFGCQCYWLISNETTDNIGKINVVIFVFDMIACVNLGEMKHFPIAQNGLKVSNIFLGRILEGRI